MSTENSMLRQPSLKPQYINKCGICTRTFSSLCNLKRHILKLHQLKVEPMPRKEKATRLDCSECGTSFPILSDILEHYQNVHGIAITNEKKTFLTKDEYAEWKEEVEKTSNARYVVKAGCSTYTGKWMTRERFHCHRSGVFKPRGQNKRSSKMAGSNKTGYFCPASMIVRTDTKSGVVNVDFISTHVGHECDPRRLPLTKKEKLNLAAQMIRGVPKDQILENVAVTFGPENVTKRLSLISRKDLHNIAATFNIGHATTIEETEETIQQEQVDNGWVTEDVDAVIRKLNDDLAMKTIARMKEENHKKLLLAIEELEKSATQEEMECLNDSLDKMMAALEEVRSSLYVKLTVVHEEQIENKCSSRKPRLFLAKKKVETVEASQQADDIAIQAILNL